jgi:glycerophosphoryl diester phosphodiesterase
MPNALSRRGKLGEFPQAQLMQLIDAPTAAPADFVAQGIHRTYADMLTPTGLAEIAAYADYLAPPLPELIAQDSTGRLGEPALGRLAVDGAPGN